MKILHKLDKSAPSEWTSNGSVVNDRYRAAAADVERRYDAAMRIAKDRGRIAVGVTVFACALGAGWFWQAQQQEIMPIFIPFNSIGDPGEVFVAHANEPPDLVRVQAAQ